ncbi:MAG TPA: bifunctional phosphopantothenoylcysteine decarboxylase/phosphopantothenate--cysteine ligase CoaBC [Bacillus sp. (in: firmicutes)]|uniref:bifunctional phosphopantothenoylcysteine decarboxylase/phosphopantothenate--cysteine ligase CoaBC n=1 Tax=Bacillus litorisediminis TaxID=2922713 RepID=UPI001FACADA8|nr:bifunctional phosphopantothenoylcysteine decarboxylase/phosphopantothenate--cysteine ligase CoaBC [Bacillus litorisediminis]HWO77901.1 bifunctional phosphopantothenoylcysteine decarboxylase/phosphopantothenate--cysteine ligase CoaBC [Bacillus sp. (in: firmicutes)]
MVKKNILLCVSGGIAAYKGAGLTSKLTQAGFSVKVIMTKSAQEFVAPLTFQALSRQPVFTDTFAEKDPNVISHIDLADWADLIVVAPATANVIGKLANGIADDMLTTTLLASTAPVWIAPAMNVHMYEHPAVQRNIQILKDYGYTFVEPNEGYLACGYVGKGRLAEPEEITEKIVAFFLGGDQQDLPLKGRKILVTAGPTKEMIDPVRYLTNRSSGKMGYSIAEEAARLGAEVTLVSGPVSLAVPDKVNLVKVESAEEMYNAVMERFAEQDAVIKSAAVADYRPVNVFDRKLKKQDSTLTITLEKTKDILKDLGKIKSHQILVGFAAETNDVVEYAMKKLKEKNLDLVVANDVTEAGAGFEGDTNIVTLIDSKGDQEALPILSKTQVAQKILEKVTELLKGR